MRRAHLTLAALAGAASCLPRAASAQTVPAVAILGHSTYASASTQVVTLALPSGVGSGVTEIAGVNRAQQSTITPPSGWTACSESRGATNNGEGLQLFLHVTGASEPASYAFAISGTASQASGALEAASNVGTATCATAKSQGYYFAVPAQPLVAGGALVGFVAGSAAGASSPAVSPAAIFPSPAPSGLTTSLDAQAVPSSYFATTVFSELASQAVLGQGAITFPDPLADTAVVGSVALTPAVGLAYVTPTVAAGPQEMPRQADSIADSVGANSHLNNSGTPAYGNAAVYESELAFTRIRHLRDSMFPYYGGGTNGNAEHAYDYAPAEARRANQIYGVGYDYLSGYASTAADLMQWRAFVGGAMEAAEGPNELDTGGGSWAATDQQQQALLWNTLHPLGITILGPSLAAGPNSYPSLGDLTAYLDSGVSHSYTGGRNPDTAAFGGGTTEGGHAYGNYGAFAWNLGLERIVDGARPTTITETGFGDPGAGTNLQQTISAAAKTTYLPRTILVSSLYRVARTYLYELADDGGGDGYGRFGMFDVAGVPKTSAVAIANLMRVYGDPGPAFQPTPLAYAIGTTDASLDHVLVQRRDGSDVLALWQERSVYDVNGKADTPVASEPVTLTFATAPSSLYAEVSQPDGTLSRTQLPSASSVTLQVGAAVTYVEIGATTLPVLVNASGPIIAPAVAPSRPFRRY